jgi:hypothetical protein
LDSIQGYNRLDTEHFADLNLGLTETMTYAVTQALRECLERVQRKGYAQ